MPLVRHFPNPQRESLETNTLNQEYRFAAKKEKKKRELLSTEDVSNNVFSIL